VPIGVLGAAGTGALPVPSEYRLETWTTEGANSGMANISFHYGHGGDTVVQLKALVDLDGDGHADAGLIDFPGQTGAGRDIAFDSNGDGKVDLILVDADGDGNYDTGYSDPGGSGAWAAHAPMEAGRLLTMFPELGDAPDPAPLPGAEHGGDPAPESPTAGGSSAAGGQPPTHPPPAHSAPAHAAPAEPTDQAPADRTPTDQAAKERAPTDQAPKDHAPKDQVPTDQAVTGRPTDLAPGGDQTQTNEAHGNTTEGARSADPSPDDSPAADQPPADPPPTDSPTADQPPADPSVDQRAGGGLSYTFGGTEYSDPPNVDVDGDGTPDGVLLDFDGSGRKDSIAWDSDGDGVVDTILVSSDHDGHYDQAYYDRGGEGRWSVTEKVSMTVGHPGKQTEQAETPVPEAAATDATGPTDGAATHRADHQVTLSYSFGDSSTATQTYSGVADTDVDGDGVKDGIALDFDGSGKRDAVAWDSDGDGKVDTILVSTHHDGTFDLAYHDPTGDGHWSVAEPINGDVTSAATGDADPKAAGASDAGVGKGHPPADPGADHTVAGGDHAGPDSHHDHPGAPGDTHAEPGPPGGHDDDSTAHDGAPAPELPADDPSDPARTHAGYDVGGNDDPYAHLADNNHSDGFLHGWQS